ncbi:MAG: cystathionine gamma-synthase [Actinomycetota bacterium]
MRFETRAIHAGQEPDPATGAVAVPIYQTSTFVQESVGRHKGYSYSRLANPTRSALEAALASLEEAGHALAFASGMAAEDAVFRLLQPGDHLITGLELYGGTRRLIHEVLAPSGVGFSVVDPTRLEDVRGALRPSTRMLWIETPTNPSLQVADLAAIAAIAHRAEARLVVDNTFATPFLQRPLNLGADVVVHSTTKYIGGHSDLIGGAACTSDEAVAEKLKSLRNTTGGVPGPFDCWLALRGIKTLAVRMRQHCDNAARVAEFLCEHPAVTGVRYPGLADHPGHEVAARQMDGFGGMIAFEVASPEQARRIVEKTRVFLLGESLGGVESLIGYPAVMSHAAMSGTPFAVSDRLIRLSVGIEHIEDLIEDLKEALSGGDPPKMVWA